MAGIVGVTVPKYRLFGETVNMTTRIKAYSNRKYA